MHVATEGGHWGLLAKNRPDSQTANSDLERESLGVTRNVFFQEPPVLMNEKIIFLMKYLVFVSVC